ncbi:hypothetical protein X274_07900 [Marinitoga sp. 1155]|nr:AAA family ATPase [Marinitoga sp. 1155]KLO22519.1 hypothetical protein X274_07900 [Marinitoga sp. 1155]
MKKLPIGVQDYKEIIEENYIYVDKTKYIFNLIDSGKFYYELLSYKIRNI